MSSSSSTTTEGVGTAFEFREKLSPLDTTTSSLTSRIRKFYSHDGVRAFSSLDVFEVEIASPRSSSPIRRHSSLSALFSKKQFGGGGGGGENGTCPPLSSSPRNSRKSDLQPWSPNSPLSTGSQKIVGRIRSMANIYSDRRSSDLSSSDEPELGSFEKALLDPAIRSNLIDALLSSHMRDATLQVRCVNAIHEFQKTTNNQERKAKGAKIISLFVDPDSNYRLSYIPIDVETRLLLKHEQYDSLVALKSFLLSQLQSNRIVTEFLQL